MDLLKCLNAEARRTKIQKALFSKFKKGIFYIIEISLRREKPTTCHSEGGTTEESYV
jgi:hypothetical protein